RTVADVRAAGGEVASITADLTSPEACAAVVTETVRAFGRGAVLRNNAHAGARGPGAGRQRARDVPGQPRGGAAHADGRRWSNRQYLVGLGLPRVGRAPPPWLRRAPRG